MKANVSVGINSVDSTKMKTAGPHKPVVTRGPRRRYAWLMRIVSVAGGTPTEIVRGTRVRCEPVRVRRRAHERFSPAAAEVKLRPDIRSVVNSPRNQLAHHNGVSHPIQKGARFASISLTKCTVRVVVARSFVSTSSVLKCMHRVGGQSFASETHRIVRPRKVE